jgi:protein O-GlcNAc transferase
MTPIDPDLLDALIKRGNVLEATGDTVGALALYDEAAQLAPDQGRPQLNRGNALTALSRFAEAEAALQQAYALGATAAARLNLGNLYLLARRLEEAASAYAEALKLRPGWEAASFGELCVLYASGNPKLLQAIESFLADYPGHAAARQMRLNIFSAAPPEQILAAIDPDHCIDPELLRLRYAAGTRLFDHTNAMVDLRRAVQLDPSDPESLCALAFAIMIHPGTEGPIELLPLIRQTLSTIERAAPALRSMAPYRIGYLSGDYTAHPAASFLLPIFLGHRRDRFVPVALANVARPDAMTARFQTAGAEWIDLSAMNDQAAEARLREAGLDVIVDFSGWTMANRLPLLARRIAPVQITTIGIYQTTGVPEIDFRICDAASDPPGLTETQHSETLLRTNGPHVCYHEFRAIPSSSIQPARLHGHFTFGYFNAMEKITSDMINQWIAILQRAPTTRLKILGVRIEVSRRCLIARFTEAGVNERVTVLDRLKTHEYAAMLTTVDLALDSHPYNGGTTTIETLLAGVPVLTHSGPWSFSRSARVFLEPLGLSDWAVDSAEAFVERAVQVATGPIELLETLRAELPQRVRASPLMDQTGYIERWEAVLLQAIKLRQAALRG